MPQNPFRSLTKEEQKKREDDQKAIAEKMQQVMELGQKVLASPDCVKYRQELEKKRDDIIRLAIRNNEPDPVRYAFACKAVFTGLGVLYGLLEAIERDAKPRPTA